MSRSTTHCCLLASALLAGCSAENSLGSAPSTAGTLTGSPTATFTGDTGSTGFTNSPVFFAIDGTLEVQNDDVDPALSTIDVDYRNGDAQSICSGVRVVQTATTEVNTDPDLPLFGWWTLTLDPSPCGDFGPDEIRVGIGAWDPQLDAAAAAQNLDGTMLYGLYLQPDLASPVYVFGASGTSEQFSGTTPPVTQAPLPDGVYQLRSLFLLHIDAQ